MENQNLQSIAQERCLQFYFRRSPVYLTTDQRFVVEQLFTMRRVIVNNLITKYQSLVDSQARLHQWTFGTAETETLRFLNDQNYPFLEEGYLTPGLLKGILLAFIAEWEDFRAKRFYRPKFIQRSDTQSFWFLDSKSFTIGENSFRLEDVNLEFTLRQSTISLPRVAKAHNLIKDESGNFLIHSLHETIRPEPHPQQDPQITTWGRKILSIENEERRSNRKVHYLGLRNNRQTSNENLTMTLRLIILNRILRERQPKEAPKQEEERKIERHLEAA